MNPIWLKQRAPKSICVFQEVVTWRLWVWINCMLPWQQCHKAEGQSWSGQNWARTVGTTTHKEQNIQTLWAKPPPTHKVSEGFEQRVYFLQRLYVFLETELLACLIKKRFTPIKICIDLNVNPLNETVRFKRITSITSITLYPFDS